MSYSVTPNLKNDQSIHVEFSRHTDEHGQLVLILENESMGESDLFNCLKNLEVHPTPKSIEIKKDSSLIYIYGSSNAVHQISYDIVKDYNDPPLNRYRYRPIVDSTYFHVLGTKLFMYPSDLFSTQDAKVRIDITWNFADKQNEFHSSFGNHKQQHLNISQDELHNSFFVGGDFRRYEFNHQNKPVHFLTRGQWKPIKDKEVLNILERTIRNQYTFWNDSIDKLYSVSLIPTYETNSYSVGGSALTDSFISYASNNIGTTIQGLTWLYNHELMHKWIGRTIQIEEDVVQYWFSEGFTDYYAYKLMLKNNDLDLQGFINVINNEIIVPHYGDTVATIPNSELTFETYWSNYATYAKLPYRRGLLYAFLIDTQIKQQSEFSKSLDDLMFELITTAKEDADFRINERVFQNYLIKYLDEKSAINEFESYIVNGELINFKGKLLNGLILEYENDIPKIKIDAKISNELLKQLQL